MKYYRVIVSKTSKTPYRKEAYHFWDTEVKKFDTLEEMKEYLSFYKGMRREKMYIGERKHIGYIYTFRNRDISHNSEEWIQQDWVEAQEVDEYFKRVL